MEVRPSGQYWWRPPQSRASCSRQLRQNIATWFIVEVPVLLIYRADRVQDVAVQVTTGVAAAFLVLAVLVLIDHARPIQVLKHWARAFIWATQLHSLARSLLRYPTE